MGQMQTNLAVIAAATLAVSGCKREEPVSLKDAKLPPLTEEGRANIRGSFVSTNEFKMDERWLKERMPAGALESLEKFGAGKEMVIAYIPPDADTRNKALTVSLAALVRNPNASTAGNYDMEALVVGVALEQSVERGAFTQEQGIEIANKFGKAKNVEELTKMRKELLPKGAYERATGAEE